MAKLLTALLLLVVSSTLLGQVQTTETFSGVSSGASTFTSNSQGFTVTTISNPAKPFDNNLAFPGTGWSGVANDNGYIDNDANIHPNPSFSIKTTDATGISVQKFFLYLGNNSAGLGGTGTLNIVGKNGVNTEFTINTSSGYVTSTGTNNGFTEIDLTTYGGSNNSNTTITELIITTSGDFTYLAFDAFTWSTVAANTAPTIGGAFAGQAVNDNATISPFSSITIADAEGDNLTATVTLDNNAKGIITGASSGAGPYTISSRSSTAMQSALRALVFNPTDNRSATTETTTFTVVVNDGTDNTTNNTTTVVSSAVAPSVSSITLSGSPVAAATSVTYVVAFNESVVNVSTDDFALTKGSTANGTIASVSAASGTSINVVVNSITGTGTLRLDLKGGTNINDTGGKGISGAFTSGSSHTVDRDAPSVTSITLSGSPTATATSVTYVVAFSESVANVSTDDFALTKGSTANGTIASVSASTGTSVNVVVNSITGTGTLRLDLNGSTNIADASGNTPPAAFTSGSSHTVDRDAPSVTSITLSGSPTATATSVTYVVAFSESVANVSTDDFALTKGSTANGTIASVSASTGTSINVVVNSITGTGTLRLDLNGSTNIADASGNTPPAAFTSGSSHTVDRDAPSVTSITLSGSPTATATSVTYVVAFSESVANVSTDDFALTKGSTANGTIASVSASTGTSINVVVNSITGTGTLRLDLNGSTNIADASGNTPPAAFTSGSSHTVDRDAPSVTSITLSGSPGAADASITYVVAFSESVANVSTDDFALTKGSTANGTIASVSASTGTSINVVVNSITGTGTLRLDLKGSTNIADASGNTPPAAFTSGSSHTVDRDAPTLSSSNPVDNATSVSASGNITLTFSENIAFGTGNIQVIDVTDGSNSFTIDAASPGAQASISNTVLTINPSSDLDENANYAIQIAATAIDDLSGNSYAGILNNTTLDFTTADVTAPTVQSGSPTDDATNVTLSQNLTITFDDNIVVGTGNITIVETGVGNFEQLDVTNGALVSVSTTTVTLNPNGTMKKGTAYHILIDATALDDDAANSFAGIADATTLNFTTVDVVINEVVTDPQQDWSTNGFNGTAGAGTISDGVDEFVELLINSAGIDFAGWTIELNDGSNVTGDLSNTGAFDATTYSGTGTFNNTAAGDYLVLGNVDGAGAMNNTGLTINLKDPGGAIVDAIVIGGGVGEAPTGDATSVADESVQRFTNGLDTDTNNSDFTKGPATMGATNTGPSVTLSQSTTTLAEAAGTNTITATLSATSSQNTTVTIGVKAGGTATITNDFTLSTTSIVITAGNTTGTATLTAVQDALDEDNETVTIEITGVTNGSENATQEVASTITDDDAEPTVTLSQSTTTFAEAAGTNTVTATLSAASGKDVTVTVGVKAGGTATITNDFTLSTTSIVITAGNTTGTATLTAVQDALDEDNETVTIEITGVTNGSENATQEVASTITDDDAEPTVTLSQSTTTFAEAAGTNTVTATLSAASGKDVTVTIGVKAGGTATITNDFTLSTTSIVITAGNTTGTATLTAVQDVIDEDNESVTIEITGVTNGSENATQEVESTITDDDAEPTVTLSQSTTTFAEAAGTNTVTATLSAASGKDVTVTIGVKAGGTATITNDFTLSTTSIVITAGNTTGTATLTAVQDVIDEDNETVTIEITGVTNGSENATQEVASTITDDDAEPTVTLSQSTTTFAEAAGTNTVTATLSAASGKDVTVTIGVKAGGTATITNDFTLSTTSIVITAGNTTGTATLTAVQDVIDEDNETVTIEITGVTNGSENATQEVASTITDDDAEPTVTLSQSTTTFAEAAGTNTVTATLSAASGKDVTVTIGVKAGGTATITNDFTLSTTSIVITAGNTTGTATLTAVQDALDEDNETVTIEITGVTNGSENGTQEVASSITDDDAEPSVTLTQSTTTLAEAAGTNTVTATLSAASGKDVTVTIGVKAGGTATITNDFTLSTTSIVITAGNTTGTATLTAVQDALDEDNETVTIEITGVTNGSENATQEVASSITDDDAAPTVTLSVGTANIAEAVGTSTITATLSAISAKDVTVNLGYTGTATNGTDYNNTASTSIVITAGNTAVNAAVGITATQDANPETNETIIIDVTGVTNGTEDGTQQQTITIIDDDTPSVTFATTASSGAESVNSTTIPVNLSIASGLTVTVDYAVTGTATGSGTDYTLADGTLTFTPASTTQNLTIGGIANDLLDEFDETVVLTLSSPSNANLGTNTVHTYTITDDDAAPTVTLTQSTTTLAEAAGTNTVTATLSAVSGKDVTVTVGVKAGGTATITNDFTLSTTSIVITAGNTTGTATLTAVQDALDEDNETVTIEITGVTNGSENATQEVASTITDDDAEPTVTLSQSTTTFAEAAGTNTVTATLSAASGKDVTVTVGVKAGGTATITNDFTLSTTSIVITAGNTTGTATLTAVQDALDEDNETVTIEITGVTNGSENATQEVASTITDDDAEPTVTLSQSTTTFAEAAGTNTVTATLSAASGKDVTVTIGVKAGGTATITNDFTLSTTSIVITAGNTTGTATLTAVQDVIDEDNESVTIEITGVTNGSENATQEVESTITDDDAEPTVTLSQSTTTFAEAAGTNTVTATLSAASGKDVTVTIGVKAGGTATITNDFTLSTTSIVITAGNTTGTATLTAVQDVIDEDNETVTIEITGVTNGSENATQEVASTITDDDAEPTVTLSQSTTTFAEAAGTNTVTATLSAASGKDVTVTIGVKAGGTATITNDFTLSTTSIVITAGNTTGTATLTAVQDALDEDNETVTIEITGVTNGSENATQEVASSITDDDAEPTVTLSQSTTTFAEAAGTNTVTATLSAASGKDVTVTIGVKAGGTATITNDFTLSTTSIVITAGNTTGTATLTAVQDVIDEDNETVTVEVTGVTNGSENATQEVASSITDDDAAPTVAFGLTADGQSESEASQDIQVSLSAKSGKTITVDYAVTGTATAGGVDHTTVGGTITFNPGDQDFQQQIVGIVDDALDEENETIILTLSNPTNASLGANTQLVYTITDNDAAPTVTLSVGTANIAEAAGTSTITATLSAISAKDVTVNLGYTGTATNGTDYNNTASTSIVITAGNLSANAAVGITATQDVNPETNETIIIDVTGVTNGTEDGIQQQTITITDDDTPSVTFATTASSGAESVNSATIPVNLSIASGLSVTVNYTVTGTATGSGTDYTLADGTLTFTPASTTQNITIASIVDDAILESNETVIVTLSSPINANLGANTVHTYTITDNDAAAVTIADVSGNENGGVITVTATLDNAVQGGFTVDVSSADGTATTADSDYTAVAGQTLTFTGTAGETQTFTVAPTADSKLEANETLTISQGNLATTTLGVTIADGATVTVTNDDVAAVTIADVSGNEDSGAITVTATLDNAVQGGFTVDVSTADGTANIANSDYTAVAGQTLTFTGTAGETETFTVTPTADANAEGNETITVSQGNLAATTLAVNITDGATVTINDDDDGIAPIGYSITFDDALIGNSEVATSKFTFAAAEVGATYNYTVSSSGGGTAVTGTGTIATATDQITLASLSGLTDGTLTLSVTLTDPSANVGSAVTANTSFDATSPAAPVASSITSDSGINGADEITTDNTPDVNGTAEANSTVEVFIGGSSVGTTTADGTGNWNKAYSGASPLADGTIQITAQSTDAAGNTSPASSALSVTVDTSAPAAPVVSSITSDSGTNGADQITNDQTLSFNGTAEANASIELFINATSIGSTTADVSGNFSFDYSATTLVDATYAITAKATDAAGNTSAESSAFGVTVDTSAPSVPVPTRISVDSGVSSTDLLTNDNTLAFHGTADANSIVEVFIDGTSIGTSTTDGSGEWTHLHVFTNLPDASYSVTAKASDLAGNTSAESTVLIVTVDTSLATPSFSPADNATDILPDANLTLTFAEDVNKGTGNITIKKSSDGSTLEVIDVTNSSVSIVGGVVTINPENNILPPASEFYVNIDAGALTDNAGNPYAGITNATDWSFTIISASTVSSVTVPSADTYGIGNELDFTVAMVLPVNITGTATIPVTIGNSTVSATQVGTVSNSSTITFRYTVMEDQLDSDGIVVGSAINPNGGTIKDAFGTDAILTLNNVATTTSVLVDGVRPTPTISNAATTDPVNGVYTVLVEFDEPVAGFGAADLTVSNGTSSNFTNLSNDVKWSFDITPTADGTVSVSLLAGVASDNAGNGSTAGVAVTKTFDGTPPEVSSITRKDADQLNTSTTAADFRVVFSENALGVDLTDFELTLTGTTGVLNTVTQINSRTYDVNVDGISGQGTIGLNLKDDDSIIDNVGNKLGGAGLTNGDFVGQVYTTNFLPTDIILTPASVTENNAVGAVVGTLTSADLDAGDSHAYTLVSGAGDADNGSFIVDGTNLEATASFDFETKDSYTVRVRTDDGKGGRFEKALTITVDNVLEAAITVTGDASFDVSALGLSQQRTLTVTNNGEKAVEIRVISTPAGFSVLPGALVLPVGASADVVVTFVPTAVRNYGGNIIFNHEGGNEAHPVSGEGAIITSIDNEVINAENVKIFPNPANRFLTIDLSEINSPKLDISIVNAVGTPMFNRDGFTDKELTLDVSRYEMGIYILQFTDGQSVVRKKVMIKR